jgi:hypothetical protein
MGALRVAVLVIESLVGCCLLCGSIPLLLMVVRTLELLHLHQYPVSCYGSREM